MIFFIKEQKLKDGHGSKPFFDLIKLPRGHRGHEETQS